MTREDFGSDAEFLNNVGSSDNYYFNVVSMSHIFTNSPWRQSCYASTKCVIHAGSWFSKTTPNICKTSILYPFRVILCMAFGYKTGKKERSFESEMVVGWTTSSVSWLVLARFQNVPSMSALIAGVNIEHTLTNMTQYGRNLLAMHSIKENLKSQFPANNVHRRHEPVATDTVFANVATIGSDGCKMAQGFIGWNTMVADVYLMKSQKEFVQTLMDTIVTTYSVVIRFFTESLRLPQYPPWTNTDVRV